jgi:uncharacterized protein (TIGR02246 family)
MLRRNFALAGCAALLALTAGCADMHRSMMSERADTREADTKAVKDLETAWSRDAATKNPATFASYYSEDASLLLPGAPMITGREAILNALKPMMSDPNFALQFSSTKAEASKGGDLVYTLGTYTMTVTGPDKKPATDKGKFATIFKKQADASWKVVADVINSDSAH